MKRTSFVETPAVIVTIPSLTTREANCFLNTGVWNGVDALELEALIYSQGTQFPFIV